MNWLLPIPIPPVYSGLGPYIMNWAIPPYSISSFIQLGTGAEQLFEMSDLMGAGAVS